MGELGALSLIFLLYTLAVSFLIISLFRCLRRAVRDYVTWHLFYLGLSLAALNIFGYFRILLSITAAHSSALAQIVYIGAPFSLILTVYYVAFGTVTFLSAALFEYRKEDVHADGRTTLCSFAFVWLLSVVLALLDSASAGELLHFTSIIIFASLLLATLTIIFMLYKFVVEKVDDHFARKHFFVCIVFSIVVIAMQTPSMASSFALLFFAKDHQVQAMPFGAQFNVSVLNEFFPVFSIALSFLFFASLRHGLSQLMRPVPVLPASLTEAYHLEGAPQRLFGGRSAVAPPPPFGFVPPPPPYAIYRSMQSTNTAVSDSHRRHSHSCIFAVFGGAKPPPNKDEVQLQPAALLPPPPPPPPPPATPPPSIDISPPAARCPSPGRVFSPPPNYSEHPQPHEIV